MYIPRSVRVVLFDLDGTLVDHVAAARIGLVEFAAHFGVPGAPEELARRWFSLERRWFTRFERGQVSHVGQRIGRCREFLDRPGWNDEEALAAYEVYLAAYLKHWRAFEDAAGALDAAFASGRQVAVLTNGANPIQSEKLTRTGLARPDLPVLTATELGAAKPQPAAYTRALQRLDLDPARVGDAVLIGDSLANDVRGARRAGLQAVHLSRVGGGEISSLNQLRF